MLWAGSSPRRGRRRDRPRRRWWPIAVRGVLLNQTVWVLKHMHWVLGVVLKGATCEWSTESDCLTVRVPAGLVAKAGHVPSNGGTASEEKASLPVSLLYSIGPKPVSCGIPFGSRLSKSYLTFVFLAVVVETFDVWIEKDTCNYKNQNHSILFPHRERERH